MTSMGGWPIEWYNSVLGLSQNVFHQENGSPSNNCYLKTKKKSVWWLYPSARLSYKTSIFRFVAVAFKSDSADEHKPWRRMTCSSYFKAPPQIEQLPHLNQSCECSAVFFLFSAEQFTTSLFRRFWKHWRSSNTLPSHDCWDHQFGLLRFIGGCFLLCDQDLHHGEKHPTLAEWKSTCGVRQR